MLNSTKKITFLVLLILCSAATRFAISSVASNSSRSASGSPSSMTSVPPPCGPMPSPTPVPDVVEDFQQSQVVVQVKPGASINDVNHRNGTTTINQIGGTQYYLVGTPPGSDTQAMQTQLAADPGVQNADLNYLVHEPFEVASGSIMGFPNDHAVPGKTQGDYEAQRQAISQLLGLSQAQQCATGAGKEVAIIDTGIDMTHPQLSAMIDRNNGWDFYGNTDNPNEYPEDPQTTVAGHGTFIAGLIAIMAPGCKLMPVKAFSPLGVSDQFTVTESVKYATDHGADVINLSCGTHKNSALLRESIGYAREHGVIVVAAVGNDATDKIPEYPASLTAEVIGVASVETITNICSSFSNYGFSVSVDAYGDQLISTYPGGGYAMWSGTSFATPLTSGEAALILSANPDPATTRQTIEDTAVNIDKQNLDKRGELGKGLINPAGAVLCVGTTPTTNPATTFYSRIDFSSGGGLALAAGRRVLRSTAVGVGGGATGGASGPAGRAELSRSGTVCSIQRVRIIAYGLQPLSSYSIQINGYTISGLVSSGFGGLEVIFSDSPGNGELALPPVLNPVTGVSSVGIDSSSGAVLTGTRTVTIPVPGTT